MTTIQAKLHSAASDNTRLLATLAATDYAPPAMTQQQAYMADLTAELARTDASLAELTALRAKELKDHEKYRDSVLRRFAYKATRKEAAFAEKAAKEEREYFDVLQREHRAADAKARLAASLAEAQTAQRALAGVVAQNQAAQRELDALYEGIFAGPTPAFPAEDDAEGVVQRALTQYREAGAQKEAAQQVIAILRDAQTIMGMAQRSIEDALSCSRMDMFGGGALTDMMERSNLSEAETHVQTVHRLVAQASRLAPQTVQPLPQTGIAQGSLMSDVFFDNIFTDMAFHDKIKESQMQLQRAATVLGERLHTAKVHLQERESVHGVAVGKLDDARAALQKRRQEAFESVNA